MIQTDDVVKKLFGHNRWTEEEKDHNSVAFIKKAIKEGPDAIGYHYEQTAAGAIKDFLFEQTDVAKQLKEMMEKLNESDTQENS